MESKCPCRIRRFLPESALCAEKDCLRPKRTHYAGKAILCRNLQGVIMQVCPKYPPSIPQVSTKYPPRRWEGALQDIPGRPGGRGLMGNRRTVALRRVAGSRKISDLKKFGSFADFWKKGLFFEVDSIVTFCLSYYFIFNGIGDPPAAD